MSESNTETVTDIDLARLLMLATLHSGYLPDVPHGALDSFRRLDWAELVAFDETADGGNWPARITPLGSAVTAAMLSTAGARMAAERIVA